MCEEKWNKNDFWSKGAAKVNQESEHEFEGNLLSTFFGLSMITF